MCTHMQTHMERGSKWYLQIQTSTSASGCPIVFTDRYTHSQIHKQRMNAWAYMSREKSESPVRACVCVHITHNVCFMGPQLSCVSIFYVLRFIFTACLPSHGCFFCVCLGQQTDRRADWPTVPRHLTRHSVRARSHVAGHLISSTDRLTKHTRIWTRRQIWTKGQTRPCSYTQ